MSGKMITFNLKVDEDLHTRFKKIAKYNDSDASKLVRQFMKKYVLDNANLTLKAQ